MRAQGAGLTDVGRRRSLNEDAFFFDDVLGLYVVADGMGGHAAGEVASAEAVDTVHGMVRREKVRLEAVAAGDTSSDTMRGAIRLLESAVQAATYMIFGLAQAEPDRQGMGTTCLALAICGRFGITAQVGDSRVYLIRDGQITQVTEDHSLLNDYRRMKEMSGEEVANFPHKNVVVRALGLTEHVAVDVLTEELKLGDTYLLCSDGLTDMIGDAEIMRVLEKNPQVDSACAQLIDAASGTLAVATRSTMAAPVSTAPSRVRTRTGLPPSMRCIALQCRAVNRNPNPSMSSTHSPDSGIGLHR